MSSMNAWAGEEALVHRAQPGCAGEGSVGGFGERQGRGQGARGETPRVRDLAESRRHQGRAGGTVDRGY